VKKTTKKKLRKALVRAKATPPAAVPQTTATVEPLKKTEVKITAAKGRPMLTWVGKRPLSPRHCLSSTAHRDL
jgi:hypothetical protein